MLLALALLLAVAGRGCGELFTALADLEHLVASERAVIQALERAVQAEQQRLQQLKRRLAWFEHEHSQLMKDPDRHLGNPLAAFQLVKRLTVDWKLTVELATESAAQDVLDDIKSTNPEVMLPDDGDLAGAAAALVRLQDTYELNTTDLAQGKVPGSSLKRELTTSDCFEIGRQSFFGGDLEHAEPWLQEAWRRGRLEALIGGAPASSTPIGGPSVRPAEVLEFLAFTAYRRGDTRRALALTLDLLREDPQHEVAIQNVAFYEDQLKETGDAKDDSEKTESPNANEARPESDGDDEYADPDYLALCRGGTTLKPSISKRLRCYYSHSNVPFLLLQPFPTEDARLDPHIVLFHNVMYDSEIEAIKRTSAPLLNRATVRNDQTGGHDEVSYRISKFAWLRSEDHSAIEQVERRVAQLTGLSLSTAEQLQVVNYGIGGHYEPHLDHAINESATANLQDGNRIATFMFYMSDVATGGATVFTELGVALQPRRGSAAFWYNLLPDGRGDLRTRHAACPVLVGSKWVANKWIHEHGNEFRRPCGLSPDL